MTRLNLEFIERRALPWRGLAFLVLAAAWSAQVAADRFTLRNAVERQRAHVAAREASLATQREQLERERATASPATEQRLTDEKAIVAALNYPWNRVLGDIERTSGDKVGLLTFSHDQTAGTGQLSVEALDFPALTGFVESLNDGREGRRWYVASYQTQAKPGAPSVKAGIVEK